MENSRTILAVKIPVIESEAGWGAKIDDYMVCLSNEDGQKFIESFNSKNTESKTPDWYMYAENKIIPIDLTVKQATFLFKLDKKRMWLSSIKDIK